MAQIRATYPSVGHLDDRYVNVTGDTMTGGLTISSGGLTVDGATVFNEAGADVDFRIESVNGANTFFVDASTDRIGVGTNSPTDAMTIAAKAAENALSVSANLGYTFLGWKNRADNSYYASQNLANPSGDWQLWTVYGLWYERIRVVRQTGHIGFNETAPGGQFHIQTSGAAVIGQIIRGSASQSANLLELQESDGSIFLASGDGLASSEFVINEQGEDIDFRVEGDSFANLLFTDAGNDRVGIGTNAPDSLLHILGDDVAFQTQTRVSNTGGPGFILERARGSIGSETILNDGDRVYGINAYGYDGSAYREMANICAYVDGTPGASDMPGRLEFYTSAGTSPTLRFKIHSSGKAQFTEDVYTAEYMGSKCTTAPLRGFEMRGTGSSDGALYYSGSAGGGGEGILYKDAAGSGRYSLFFPGSDVVALGNRASSGTLSLRANNATAGAGGEYSIMTISRATQAVLIDNPDSANIGLTVKGASSQSANLQEWQDSSATILSSVDSAGNIYGQNIQVPDGGYVGYSGGPEWLFDNTGGDISTTSNVGINQTAPSEKLHVGNGNLFLDTDSDKVILGAGKDMYIYYDGADANIDTDIVAASDLVIDCGTEKTIELEEVVYEDIQVSISNIRVPASNAPTERLVTLGIGGGVTFPVLGFATGDYLYFDIQTSHAMKLNTVLDNHVHWTSHASFTATHRFAFQLDVLAAGITGTWAVPTGSPYTSADQAEAAGDETKHQLLEIADIASSNTTVSSVYKCKLTRVAPATGTDEAQEIYIHFTDCHYQKNTMGSRQEGAK